MEKDGKIVRISNRRVRVGVRRSRRKAKSLQDRRAEAAFRV
jgi:hypothetical protein